MSGDTLQGKYIRLILHDAICESSYFHITSAIYTSDKNGSDENGNGTESNPFKTILRSMHFIGSEPFPVIYVDGKEENVKYEPAAKSQMKKIQKIWEREVRKVAEKSKKDEEDSEKRMKNLEVARKIVIEEDKSLPEAKQIKITNGM